MYDLLKEHQLRLLLARDKVILKDTFDSGVDGWSVVRGRMA